MILNDEERTDDLSEEKDNFFTLRGTNPTIQSTSTSSNMNLIILVIVLFLLMVLGLQYQIYSASVSLQQVEKELKY